VGGLAGILWSLRRPTTEDVPGVRVLDLLPRPFDAVVRSATIAVIGLAFLGMLATVVMLLTAVPAQSALFDEDRKSTRLNSSHVRYTTLFRSWSGDWPGSCGRCAVPPPRTFRACGCWTCCPGPSTPWCGRRRSR